MISKLDLDKLEAYEYLWEMADFGSAEELSAFFSIKKIHDKISGNGLTIRQIYIKYFPNYLLNIIDS